MGIKLGIATVLILALLGFAKWSHNATFQAGVDHQIAKQKTIDDAADEIYNTSLNKALKEKKTANVEAARLLQKLNNVEGKFREIQKATADSQCRSFGAESFKLFNTIIGPEPSY